MTYKVYNLIDGEIYETTNKFKRDAYTDRCLMIPGTLAFMFHEDWYICTEGEIRIQYLSTAWTNEMTVYRLTRKNIDAFIAYLEDKEKQGAVISHIW